MPTYLRPMAPTAAGVILCGDPARALAIAQHVLEAPRMSNHHRGLWGYSGRTPAGIELSVQATGIGGPSAAAVIGELVELGMRRAVRVGTCRALDSAHRLGATIAAERVIGLDGASAALGLEPGRPAAPDRDLSALLGAGTGAAADVISVDLPGTLGLGPSAELAGGPAGASAEPGSVVDLQSATLLALARRHRLRCAVGLVVAVVGSDRLEDDPGEAASLRLGSVSAAALEKVSTSALG